MTRFRCAIMFAAQIFDGLLPVGVHFFLSLYHQNLARLKALPWTTSDPTRCWTRHEVGHGGFFLLRRDPTRSWAEKRTDTVKMAVLPGAVPDSSSTIPCTASFQGGQRRERPSRRRRYCWPDFSDCEWPRWRHPLRHVTSFAIVRSVHVFFFFF